MTFKYKCPECYKEKEFEKRNVLVVCSGCQEKMELVGQQKLNFEGEE